MRYTVQLVIVGLVSFVVADAVRAGAITFVNDYEGFLSAAGDVQTIDFETLPDGSPSYHRAQITPEFNYTDQGVTFTSAFPRLEILGSNEFRLTANNPDTNARNWLIADFEMPALAVGVFFPGHTTLSFFAADDALIADLSYAGSGAGFFVGVVSDVPIATAIGDRGASAEAWHSIDFAPIPEPASLVLLAVGGSILLRGRGRHLQG